MRLTYKQAYLLAKETGDSIEEIEKQFEIVDAPAGTEQVAATEKAKPAREITVVESDRKDFVCKIVKTVDQFTKTMAYVRESEVEGLVEGLLPFVPNK